MKTFRNQLCRNGGSGEGNSGFQSFVIKAFTLNHVTGPGFVLTAWTLRCALRKTERTSSQSMQGCPDTWKPGDVAALHTSGFLPTLRL